MNNKTYMRTDLASECLTVDKQLSGATFSQRTIDNVQIETLTIDNEDGAEKIGKPVGKYITIGFNPIWKCGETEFDKIVGVCSQEIRSFAEEMVDNIYCDILIIGLGNRFITSDAIGPQAVEGISVTRHLKKYDQKLFDALGKCSISAFVPGVVGQTGIETFDLIKGAVEEIKPSLLILIDALASKSVDRLAKTMQLSDSGLSPGSGIGNCRRPLNREELGVPVLAIGVPTIVDSSTLVYDALEKSGTEEISDSLKNVLETGKSFFVTLKESDIVISDLSKLISRSINDAFTDFAE